ncbi:hypothetical protein GCM10011360_07390 [Primorskyibacter flagellatus]|uniref:Uncharacterized protein n=1 Tax=Primorskyibacter flagellatus TaxID=1387277 RepID=A0A917A0J3_9RHOB|nr:hypothetical protein [Primorskyibacter flagellatus]GGE21292.1 hypothetical protein GCM10011360_07390 [Primorskyibacter flagellatus]
MIELLVIIAIATIGVVYTSSTGEAESSAMAEKTAKDALNEAEGQSGIGILGIDVVARKMRRMVGLQDGAVGADTLAEYRGSDEDEDQGGEPVALAGEDQFVFAGDRDARAGDADDDWDGEAYAEDDAAEEDWDDADAIAAEAEAGVSDEEWAEDDLAAEEWDEDDLDDMDDPDMGEWAEADMDDADATDRDDDWAAAEFDEGEWAEGDDDLMAGDLDEDVAPEVAARPAMDTEFAPLVDEFDPEQDQLVIGYRPGEAGNGRIGIIEDPLRPGSAAVTLGGRCVAVVLDGFGRVRAHHIELVCEEDDADLAA